jgi:hypothetical protein
LTYLLLGGCAAIPLAFKEAVALVHARGYPQRRAADVNRRTPLHLVC